MYASMQGSIAGIVLYSYYLLILPFYPTGRDCEMSTHPANRAKSQIR